MRRVVLVVSVSIAAVSGLGCSDAPAADAPTAAPTVDAELERLHDEVAAVARTQAVADARLAESLEAARAVVDLVSTLRAADRVDAGVDRWPSVDAAFTSVDEGSLRAGLLDLARHIDEARATLREVRPAMLAAWEGRYLDAEDALLVELRQYAEVADRLAQTIQRVWPVYAELHERVGDFVERRWFYRTPQEAADAFELEVQPLLDDLARSQAALVTARTDREEAAEEVNEASAEAAAAWADRGSAATPSGGG